MTDKMYTPTARTALQGRAPLSGALSMRELPLTGKISLRGDADDARFASAVSASFGGELPTAAGQSVQSGNIRIGCLGPDEWMLSLPLDGVQAETERLCSALVDVHAAVVDVSDYFTVLEVSGEAVRDVLAKLTPLDVSAAELPEGSMRQTRMAKCSVLMLLKSDNSALLQVRWSHAEYLWDYIEEAAREFNRDL